MIALGIVLVVGIVGGIGAYQIYLDNKDKR